MIVAKKVSADSSVQFCKRYFLYYIASLLLQNRSVQQVPTGFAGDPTAFGNLSGGAVRKNLDRFCARRWRASSVKYQNSPRLTPSLNSTCWCSGTGWCGLLGSAGGLAGSPSTANWKRSKL
jgi:hypothetical protein